MQVLSSSTFVLLCPKRLLKVRELAQSFTLFNNNSSSSRHPPWLLHLLWFRREIANRYIYIHTYIYIYTVGVNLRHEVVVILHGCSFFVNLHHELIAMLNARRIMNVGMPRVGQNPIFVVLIPLA